MVTPCVFGRDGVGNVVRDYLTTFVDRGWPVDVYHHHRSAVLPHGMGNHWVEPTDLLAEALDDGPSEATGFFDHDCFVFQFVFPYPLLDVIRAVDGGRVIVDYHGITPPWFFPVEDPYWTKARQAMARHGLLDFADVVVVHSRSMADELLRIHPVPPSCVEVVPLGVGPTFGPGPPCGALRARLAPDGGPLLLYVGRLSGNKQVEKLVDMLALVRQQLPTATLALVGAHDRTTTPTYRRAVDLAVQRTELGSAVHFVDDVTDDYLPRYYRTADVFVTASVHEGFCLPVAEAMSCGTPCVVPDVSATPETMGSGGMVCQPTPEAMAEAVVAALTPDRHRYLATRALDEARRYAPDAFAARIRRLVETALARPRRPRPAGSRALALLEAAAPPDFAYVDEGGPDGVLGRAVRWFRRKVTLPAEVSTLRPLRDRQGAVNRALARELRMLSDEVAALCRPIDDETKG